MDAVDVGSSNHTDPGNHAHLQDHQHHNDHATSPDEWSHLLHGDTAVHYLDLFESDHPFFDHRDGSRVATETTDGLRQAGSK